MITHLKVGDTAPAFTTTNQSGEQVTLADNLGKKVVLFFYPKDNTPGCTKEACNIRDNYDKFDKDKIVLFGISPDDEKKHQKFIAKYDFQFPLLVDTDLAICKAYGIWGLKKFMGKEYDGLHRTTFIIDENGTIESIIKKVKTKEHAQQILDALAGEEV